MDTEQTMSKRTFRVEVSCGRKQISPGHASQDGSQEMWQTQAAHQSNKKYECDDYIFVFATEVNEKTTIDLDDVLERNYMTV